jgi:hypothetical protein
MKTNVTNTSKANQGVWTDDGLVHLAPGETRLLVIAEDYVERARGLPFLSIAGPGPTADTGDDTPATAEDIASAIGLLDPANDDHWTKAGLPEVAAVAELAGKPVTRAAITAAAPDAKRPDKD